MAAKGCLCGRIAHWNNVPIFGSCPNESSLSLPRERFLHTAVILNSDLVVFGGRHVHKTEVNHPGYHNGDSICMCVIWTYDIDAECWRKHLTPALHAVPRPRTTACAVLLEGAVYMHGGHTGGTDNGYTSSSELWKLMRSKNGTFRWGKIKFPSRSCVPSVRYEHTGWQYNNMMWIFGGRACNPSGYLHDHGEFVAGVTNQLMCYSPDNQTWVDVGSTGAVPPPRGGHATASMGSHVWLYGGFTPNHADSNVYELDLRTLTWTKFNFPPPNSGSQKHYLGHTLTSLTEYTLILHGGYRTLKENDTYSLDLNTMCWSHRPIRRPHGKMQCGHTATSAHDGSILIFGGRCFDEWNVWTSNDVHRFSLGTVRSLQSIAKRAVYRHRARLLPLVHSIPHGLRDCLNDGGDPTEKMKSEDKCMKCCESKAKINLSDISLL